jgi:DNA polymerase (family 10)
MEAAVPKNAELAGVFEELADLLEYQGENAYKLRAYRTAARTLRGLSEDVARVAEEGRLTDLPGVGQAIAKKIEEFLATGRMRRHQEALAATPPGVAEMLRVPGLGPRTVSRIVQTVGARSLEELRQAARAGRLRDLPGFGPRKEAGLLRRLDAEVPGGGAV